LILKRDGSTLYPTRDIAAAVYRKDTYDFEKCIYVTSCQQSLHFAQWFKVVEMMQYPWHDQLVHVPYGTISVAGVKLSTRHGNMLLLRDVFAAAIEKVDQIMAEKNPDLKDREATAEAVGVGAVVFHYLSSTRTKDISFILEDALSFEGNSGPYAQYTYARASSVLEKGGEGRLNPVELTEEENELIKTLATFPEKVNSAIADYEPSIITRYALDLCAAYNRFYHDCKIISCEDSAVRENRLAITAATKRVLGTALSLVCMKTPEKI
jgi:arginyl-tRNA synthetase